MTDKEIIYWAEKANKIIELYKVMDKTFINPSQNDKEKCSQGNLRLAIVAGLIDAYREGTKDKLQ